MEESRFRKKIDPILRDIKPVGFRKTESDTEPRYGETEKESFPEKASKKQRRKIRFPRRLIKPLFILGLAVLILIISAFSIRSLFEDETGKASFGHLREVAGAFISISSDINKLKDNGFDYAFNGKGEELIALLKNLRASAAKLDSLGATFFIDDSTLGTASEGLDALVAFLDKPEEERLLVLFLNPSEMRPIGGFAGSYGEVILERGNVKEIKVNDIYYPDHFLKKKIVPPRQLQTVTVDWGARDAAWFFDFPTSAKKTMELIEASDVYAKDGVRFDGVVALNVRVIEDVLEFTGPIKLPEYDLTLTKDNFLEEIQQEVEIGQDKQAGENPKRVLGALTPILIERLNKLDSSDKNALAFAFLARAANKDIQFYFNDPKVERFVEKVGWAGKIASLPDDWSGDYLAVVNTNVAGGKTDARVEQKVKLKSEIDASGRVNNHLAITRRHFGRESEASWYRAKNQNFMKIFATPGAELVSLTGATPKNVSPQIDYFAQGYSRDPVLESVERTRKETKYSTETYQESGRNVFAAWFSTLPGETKTLEVNYKSGHLSFRENAKYQFVLDKQSGVESVFEYEVLAPPGYKWAESNGSTFAYKSDTIPARLIIDLTLIRD
ncbi:MAG: DUF4012 domain-containing protein [Candidatus Colwellbacteria bacterium]|nr:DUF4012 domain-containing protein [Candidatus Colwellbacteria bacterium]